MRSRELLESLNVDELRYTSHSLVFAEDVQRVFYELAIGNVFPYMMELSDLTLQYGKEGPLLSDRKLFKYVSIQTDKLLDKNWFSTSVFRYYEPVRDTTGVFIPNALTVVHFSDNTNCISLNFTDNGNLILQHGLGDRGRTIDSPSSLFALIYSGLAYPTGNLAAWLGRVLTTEMLYRVEEKLNSASVN